MQVHAVVSRLCDPIAGLDSSHLAQWLGLDPSQYTKRLQTTGRNEGDVLVPGGVYIDNADPLKVKCCNMECAQITEVNEVGYWKGRGEREREREGGKGKERGERRGRERGRGRGRERGREKEGKGGRREGRERGGSGKNGNKDNSDCHGFKCFLHMYAGINCPHYISIITYTSLIPHQWATPFHYYQIRTALL